MSLRRQSVLEEMFEQLPGQSTFFAVLVPPFHLHSGPWRGRGALDSTSVKSMVLEFPCLIAVARGLQRERNDETERLGIMFQA